MRHICNVYIPTKLSLIFGHENEISDIRLFKTISYTVAVKCSIAPGIGPDRRKEPSRPKSLENKTVYMVLKDQ
jgi:hypothetical protein